MSAVELPRCHKPGCQSATTKSCTEGHVPLEACPWFGANAPKHSENDVRSGSGDQTSRPEADFIELPPGVPLTPSALDLFLRAHPIRLIAVVGDRDSGKTTLICAIYENFLKGRFPDWKFSGSHTLMGFEERSYESRTSSGRVTPDTAHTSRAEGLQFFHLAIRVDATLSSTELMLSDRAGETYTDVRDKPPSSADLLEISKADRVAILLDGKRVADPETRGSATQSVRKLLRALIDGGAITEKSDVQILLTKKDLVARTTEAPQLERKIDDFFCFLSRDFGAKVARLTFWGIAARDPVGDMASGLGDVMKDWLSVKPAAAIQTPLAGTRASEFDRLLDRISLDYLP